MKQFTEDEFMSCAFLCGNSTDLQPLLRLGHLLRPLSVPARLGAYPRPWRRAVLFISSTVNAPMGHHNSAEEFVACLREKLARLNRPEFQLDIIGEPRFFDYADFIPNNVNLPIGLFTEWGWENYRHLFEGENQSTPWGVELLFERAGGGLLRLIHFSSEALKSLWYHSGEGSRSPRLIASIQTGQLELPEGPLERLLLQFSKRPKLWVRGYWADRWWPSEWEKSWHDRAISEMHGLYDNEVQRYGQWDPSLGYPENLPAEQYLNPKIALVRAFAQGPLVPRLRSEVQWSNRNRRVNLYQTELDSTDDGRTKIVTRRVRGRWAQQGFCVKDIKVWEDFGLTAKSSLSQALRLLESNPWRRNHYAIIPIGYEDEGFQLRNFLQARLPPITLDVHFTQELDFADLRGWKVDKR
jgi:hypothetical protein